MAAGNQLKIRKSNAAAEIGAAGHARRLDDALRAPAELESTDGNGVARHAQLTLKNRYATGTRAAGGACSGCAGSVREGVEPAACSTWPAAGVVQRAAVARELERLAEASGDAAFRRAARALRQQDRTGRPAINDSHAIKEALDLFRNGEARSMNDAFRKVARAIQGYSEPRSVAERLRRKWRAKKNSPQNN